MSEKKKSSQLKPVLPAGVVGLIGAAASSAIGQTFIGANAGNNWNATSDIIATSSEDHNSFRNVTNLISGYDIDSTGQYSDAWYSTDPYSPNGQPADWLSDGGGAGNPDPTGAPFSAWVEFTFDQSYNLGAIDIWQDNQEPYPYSYEGIKDCTIAISNDGSNWTTVFTGAIPKEADFGAPNYNEPVSLQVNANEAAAQFVVITVATTNFNYATNGDTGIALDAVMFQTSPYVPPPPPPPPAWSVNASGNWNQGSNWAATSAPNGVGEEADLLGTITSNETAYTNTAITLGTLKFNNANTYEITGNGSLTMQTSSGNAQIIVQNGTQELDLPVTIASNTTLNVASSSTLLFANPVTIDSGTTLTQTGAGTVTYQSQVTVQSNADVAFGSSANASTISVAKSGTASITGTGNVVQVDTLADGGTFDVGANEMLINYGSAGTGDPIATIRSLIASGYNGGHWNGTGIISSAAQTSNGLRYGVAWADGKDNIVSGLSSGQIEVKYTLLGDANLDGVVNGTDFSILAANFGQGVTNWDQGNFLFTSAVNGSDFSALAANFGQGDSGQAFSVSQGDIDALAAFAAANGLTLPASVPEPATLSLLSLGCAGILTRRRRAMTQQNRLSCRRDAKSPSVFRAMNIDRTWRPRGGVR